MKFAKLSSLSEIKKKKKLTCPWLICDGVWGHGFGEAPGRDLESSNDSSAAEEVPPGLGAGIPEDGVNDCCPEVVCCIVSCNAKNVEWSSKFSSSSNK